MDISGMTNGQFAGLTHFSTSSHSLFGIKQQNGGKYLVIANNGKDSVMIPVKQKTVWLQSSWNLNGENLYYYSLDGKYFTLIPSKTNLKWGSYRGDRVGIFTYNIEKEKGFVDIDYFKYAISE